MTGVLTDKAKTFLPILFGPFAFFKIHSLPGLVLGLITCALGAISLVLFFTHESKPIIIETSHDAAEFYAASIIVFGLYLRNKLEAQELEDENPSR